SRAPTEFRSVSGWLSPKHKAATLLVAGLTGPAQAAELNFCWKGAGSYSMTGRMSLPDAAMFKTILTEDDISGFKISGYHKCPCLAHGTAHNAAQTQHGTCVLTPPACYS
ncbi:MAG: hypothetical protein QMC33_11030, partial [Octadecabacter sp.]